MTRTGFQVGLEAHRERLGSEFDAHVDGPRAPRGGRAILSGVVRGQPGDEVARDADVSAPRIVAAAEDVDEALLRTRHAGTSAGSRPMARCRNVGPASGKRATACRICQCANRPPSPRTLASTSARRSLRSQLRWTSRSLATEDILRGRSRTRRSHPKPRACFTRSAFRRPRRSERLAKDGGEGGIRTASTCCKQRTYGILTSSRSARTAQRPG